MNDMIEKFRGKFLEVSQHTYSGIVETPKYIWYTLIGLMAIVLMAVMFSRYDMLGVHAILLLYGEVALYVVGIKLINRFVSPYVRLHTIFLVLTPMMLITHQYMMIVGDNNDWGYFLKVVALPIKVLFFGL